MARVGRFQVMATLQAARAVALGLSLDEAKSWGLNRGIFYAAVGGRRSPARPRGAGVAAVARVGGRREEPGRDYDDESYTLGGEKAYVAHGTKRPLRFRFGDDEQTPRDFDQQIQRRFPDWEGAWSEARAIVEAAGREDLEGAHRFFEQVYRPRRDELAAKWSAAFP